MVMHQSDAKMSSNQRYQLSFCAKRVVLQSIMDDLNYLQGVTHLIFDQAHERDRFCDILIATLLVHMREPFLSLPNLKLILMSAHINTNRLAEYFQATNIINIPSQPAAPFSEYFLEDLLMSSEFMETSKARTTSSNYDQLISQAWFYGSESAFTVFVQLVKNGKLSVNHQHSKNKISMLMAAALHGKLDFVKNIISLGGDPTITVFFENSFLHI